MDLCKEECAATMTDANEFMRLIQKSEKQRILLKAGDDDELREAFGDLSKYADG